MAEAETTRTGWGAEHVVPPKDYGGARDPAAVEEVKCVKGTALAVGQKVILHGVVTRVFEHAGRNVSVLFDAPEGEYSTEIAVNNGCVAVE